MSPPNDHRALWIAAGLTAAAAGIGIGLSLYRHPLKILKWYVRKTLGRAGLEHHIVDSDGGQFSYFKSADRPDPGAATVVLIHGLGGHAGNWFKTAQSLRDQNVVVVDLPGHGKGHIDDLDWRANALYERFVALLETAVSKDSPQVLVGNSLGGWLSIRYALDFPERVRHLVLVNSAGQRHHYDPQLLLPTTRDQARRTVETVFGDGAPRLPGFMLDALIREAHQSPIAHALEHSDRAHFIDDELAHLQIPTDIIWGTKDRLIPPRFAHRFQQRIPEARLHLLEGLGHCPQVAASHRFNRILNHILSDASAHHSSTDDDESNPENPSIENRQQHPPSNI